MKRYALVLIAAFFYSADTFAVTDTLPFGVNLAGAEFGQTNMPGVYNTDYTYPTPAEINYFAGKGFKLIRLPFRWERVQHTLGGPLDTTQLTYMNDFIDSCAVKNVQVILDMHNFGAYRLNNVDTKIGTTEVTKADFTDVWTRLATYFKSKKNIYGYDIMNQPLDLGYYVWILAAQEVIDAIRAVDKSKSIIIEGEQYSLTECWAQSNDLLKKLSDSSDKLIYSAHVFFDGDGLGKYPQNSFDSIGADIGLGVRRVKPFVEWLQNNHKKGIVSSYGVPGNDSRWLALLDNFMNYLSTNCVNGTYWAAGPWWNNYSLSIEPGGNPNEDKPQMQVLTKYLYTNCDKPIGPPKIIPAVYFYPNPFTSVITIDQGNCNDYKTVEIFDALGRRIYSGTLLPNKNRVPLSQAATGMLFVVLRGDTGTFTQKIIKY